MSQQTQINENLKFLDKSYKSENHINCVRFSKNESVRHKFAKCVAGIFATEGMPIEDIADFFKEYHDEFDGFIATLMLYARNRNTKDNQDFIQECRLSNGRRIDHLQIALFKELEFETGKSYDKNDGSIAVKIW